MNNYNVLGLEQQAIVSKLIKLRKINLSSVWVDVTGINK